MEFLPEEGGTRKHFKDIVAGYIYAVYSHIISKEQTQGTQKKSKTTLSQLTQLIPLGTDVDENTAAFVKELVSNELRDKLFL